MKCQSLHDSPADEAPERSFPTRLIPSSQPPPSNTGSHYSKDPPALHSQTLERLPFTRVALAARQLPLLLCLGCSPSDLQDPVTSPPNFPPPIPPPHPPHPPCGHTCTAEPTSLKWVVRVCPATALEFLEPRDCVIHVCIPRPSRWPDQ